MRLGVLLALVFALASVCAFACALDARASELQLRSVEIPAAEDVSMPFLCYWGYDWDERCYRDDSDRLGVGGAGDKVWRAALRFSVAAVPASAVVVTAELSLRYDGTCVAPFRRRMRCDGRGFVLDARPIFTSRWSSAREVETGPTVSTALVDPLAPPSWVTWDLTDLVSDWHSGGLANDGVLLKLIDTDETFDSPGPAFPSSSYAGASVRPRLTIWYLIE
jgi:hypothetical protein